MKSSHIFALAAALLLPVLGQAAVITVNNPSFETPIAPVNSGTTVVSATPGFNWTTNGVTNGTITTQVVTAGMLATRGTPAGLLAGNQALRLFGTTSASTVAYVTQTTGSMLAADSTYTFSINIGPISGSGGINSYSGFNITLSAGSQFSYNVATTWNGSTWTIGDTQNGSNVLEADYTLSNGYNLSLNTYTTLTMTITTDSVISNADFLNVRIAAGQRVNDYSTVFDNVQLSVVPEPSAMALAACGLVGIFGRRKGRK